MTRNQKDLAGQGGNQFCSEEKNTPNNSNLRFNILVLSCPSRLHERIAIVARREVIFRESNEPLDDQNRLCSRVMPGDKYHLLYEAPWWRRWPYGVWIERNESFGLFDRDYCPIVRIPESGPHEIVPPLKRIRFVEDRWFFEQATSPHFDPLTAPTIVSLADDCDLEEELCYRCELSVISGWDYKDYAKKWQRR